MMDKKTVIETKFIGDWFENILNKEDFCEPGITAINGTRQCGKTTFILHALNAIIENELADVVYIHVANLHSKMLLEEDLEEMAASEEFYVHDFVKYGVRVINDADPASRHGLYALNPGLRVVHIVDDSNYSQDIVLEALTHPDECAWILLGSNDDAHNKLSSKDVFAGIIEMPFVDSYEIVKKVPEVLLQNLSDIVAGNMRNRQIAFKLEAC